MYMAFNNGFSVTSVADTYVAQPGEALFANYPTPEQLNTAFPGYLLQVAKRNVLSSLSVAYDTAKNANFVSSATGTNLSFCGDEESEETLTRNVVDSIIHSASNPGWIGHYSSIDNLGNVSLVALNTSQIQTVFGNCQDKHLAADSNYITKVAAVNAITDITSAGITAVNAITW